MSKPQYFEVDGDRYKVLHYYSLRTGRFDSTHIVRHYESGVWLSLCGYVNKGTPFNNDHKFLMPEDDVTCGQCSRRDPRGST